MEKDLLLADLAYIGQMLRHNEEVGEKRFSFFITLVTAVVAGLVALATSDDAAQTIDVEAITGAALVALLIVGLLSYLRMVKRNLVTDKYKRTLDYIRRRYVALEPGLAGYSLPLDSMPRERWLAGGYAETFAVILGMLAAGILLVYVRWTLAPALSMGALIAAALWIVNAAVRGGNARSKPRDDNH